jgi:hypothetical protein
MLWNWVDIVLIILFAVAALTETMRSQEGFDLALYDAIGVVLAVIGADQLHPSLAAVTGWSLMTSYIVIFASFLVAAFAMGYLAHNQTMFTLDAFDSVVGFLCGIITAGAICHGFLRIVLLSGPEAAAAATSWLADQLLHFTLFHRADQTMQHIGEYD